MAKVFAAHDLTGGGYGALDAIDGVALQDKDLAIATNYTWGTVHYILDEDSGLAENEPDVIVPDTNAGLKRWIKKDTDIDGGFAHDVLLWYGE